MRNKTVVLSFLVIAGAAGAARINFTAGNAAVADDVNANFIELYTLNPTAWTNTASNLGYTGGNLGVGIASPLAKFQVNGGTAITLAGATGFGVFGATTAYHLAIDSTQIQTKSNATTAANLALNPLGGNVGIGVATPNAKVHVDGGSAVTLAGATGFGIFGASAGAHTAISTTQIQAKGSATTSADLLINPLGGNVGIGTGSIAPASSLEVISTSPTNRGITISQYTTDSINSAVITRKSRGTQAVPSAILSGDQLGIFATQGYDGATYGTGAYVLAVADENWTGTAHGTTLRFITTTNTTTTNGERMRIDHNGNIGINSTSPGAKLEVFDSASGSATTVGNNVAVFKNSSAGGSADGVMIWLSGEGANASVDGGNNFLTFAVGGGPAGIGSIQGSGVAGGGVTLNTTSGDYAEMLPKANPDESFKIGDIIAVDNGRASASGNGSIFMPYSSGPAVLGNSPQDPAVSKRYVPLGFVGQVKIKVRGPVQNGDFVLASRNESGVGYALNGKKIKPEDFHRVVGRAWESSTDQRVKLINCLVGVPQAYPYQEVATQIQMMSRQKEAELHQQITQLSREVAKANVQKQSDLTLLKNENVQLRSALKAQDLRLAQLEQNLARVAQRLDSKQQTVARR